MVQSYWQIGRLIVEDEQQGQARAEYGKHQLEQLSKLLTAEFGKGFDITNLRHMRRFYLTHPIQETVSLELSWSHYCRLIRVENERARDWYAKEAIDQHWSVRALDRQISKLYYERLLASQEKKPVEAEAQEKTKSNIKEPNWGIARDLMRLYKFLPAKHAISAIENQQLKLSEINKLNDPYEIDHFSFKNDKD